MSLVSTPMPLAQLAGLFLHPGIAVAGAAAISIPIAIHLLSRFRRERIDWPAMRFLLEAWQRYRRRLRLEQWLLLALRCALVALAGFALASPTSRALSALGTGPGGGQWWIVVDDGFGSRAQVEPQARRLDRLRDQARELIARLDPGEAVAVVPVSGSGPPPAPSVDRRGTRQALEALEPAWTRPSLDAALRRVAGALADRPPAGPIHVAVVSGLPRAALEIGDPPAFADLPPDVADRVRLSVSRPPSAPVNRWVAEIGLERSVVTTGRQQGVTVPVTVVLGRGGEREAGRERVRVTLGDPAQDEPVAGAEGEARWLAGQDVARVRVDLGLSVQAVDRLLAGRSGAQAVVRASLEADALAEDDQRVAVIELRRRLRVRVLGATESGPGGPGGWAALALAPETGAGVEVERTTTVRAQEAPDAWFVARASEPDRPAWETLLAAARAGAVLWIVPDPHQGWGLAAAVLAELGLETTGPVLEAPGPGWSLATGPAPAPLSGISSDFEALLQPVRVHRRLPLAAPDGADVWLRTDDGGPLVVHRRVGAGHVLVWTTALDPAWTNLPTKPLFVPLLHEPLRALVGGAGTGSAAATVGRRPALGPAWSGSRRLVGPGRHAVTLADDPDGGLTGPAFPAPGLYRVERAEPADDQPDRSETADRRRWLAVGLAPGVGNLTPTPEPVLRAWLDRQGVGWSYRSEADPTGAGERDPARASLGWPLLWALLALVAVETLLARRFSHAEAADRPSLVARVRRLVRGGAA